MTGKLLFDGDVVVSGGGLAGLTLALALHRAGVKVAVIDALPLDTQADIAFDGRASALAYTSWRMLEQIGVAKHLKGQAQRIEDILVVDGRPLDGLKPGGPGVDNLHFDRREIHPREEGEPLGYMVENRHTRIAAAKCAHETGLPVFAPRRALSMQAHSGHGVLELDGGDTLQASLIVACDGKMSRLREGAGIRSLGRRYGQSAIVLTVEHELPHEGVAYEYFMPGGPFAILPLTGNRSSLVWTEKDAPARAIAALDPQGFQEALEARFGDFLGEVKPVSQVHVYPLGLMLAERFTAERLALAGDAARTIHPIAGQGFNLGIRDAAALCEVIVDALRAGLDPGSQAALTRYERWRKTDSAALALGTDAFNLLFSNDNTALRHARGLGLSLTNAIPVARRFFMRTAGGETGDLPRLLKGEALSL
ncbi:UbiH/UbiF/VisC/COQ6 family ubiquinone biosynthesis hydroxylase [Glycocaulis alkaliphilus]|uniref:UbiH/UbiF/VisC/COQ6 family ubiquinone biosynthesis hydroxylase n=1 Tax=Glycocaulis alkaliphilus TaxID=1434191 RepID=A0A3T0EDG6_9PROT|nr:FAD-dependent monooxygenase [Glycocaulis alkaliphilus]AZU05324.1 UbiH/UbiF/VisC/COQ6 family ubiquinone biosynthesis hydroxylase [Glycocaulis alkaliphilus]GGB81568.1 2-octaprenyl-6-methoxyphenyl hydroxylase [Glycocaulis alkaliphilus]